MGDKKKPIKRMFSLTKGVAIGDGERVLFNELAQISFGVGKPDEHENTLDLLEIIAVKNGLKPAHLQGQGQHDDATMQALEELAKRHGLRTRRTDGIQAWQHRAPQIDAGYAAWEAANDRANDGKQVLWIYRDEKLEPAIDRAVAGQTGLDQLLGYPACCVREHSELGIRMREELEAGFRREHNAKTTDDLIRCAVADVSVSSTFDPGAGMTESARLFPFVQFTACEKCLRRGSPADRVNTQMKALASLLDARWANAIASAFEPDEESSA